MLKVSKKCLGRELNKTAKQIIPINKINVGYGKGQLRPDNSRDINAEYRRLAIISLDLNGMSGQFI